MRSFFASRTCVLFLEASGDYIFINATPNPFDPAFIFVGYVGVSQRGKKGRVGQVPHLFDSHLLLRTAFRKRLAQSQPRVQSVVNPVQARPLPCHGGTNALDRGEKYQKKSRGNVDDEAAAYQETQKK